MPVFKIICAIDNLRHAKRKLEMYDDSEAITKQVEKAIRYLDRIVIEEMMKEDPLK